MFPIMIGDYAIGVFGSMIGHWLALRKFTKKAPLLAFMTTLILMAINCAALYSLMMFIVEAYFGTILI